MLKALDWINWLLTIGGLIAIASGAWVTARAVILDDKTAATLAGAYYGRNTALEGALIKQSAAAKRGLYMVFAGSLMQIVAVAAQVARAFCGL